MTPFEKACLEPYPAARIAKRLECPVDTVLSIKREWQRKREAVYRKKRRAAERALRIPKDNPAAAIFTDRNETTREDRDRAAMAKWRELQIWFDNDPRSKQWDETQAVLNTMRLKRARQPVASFGGVSDIYSERGMDYHSGSKAA